MSPSMGDRCLLWGTRGSMTVVVLALVGITGFLALQSLPAWSGTNGPDVMAGAWAPARGHYGMLAMLAGSVAVACLAVFIAAPLGIAVAAWGLWYAPKWLARVSYKLMVIAAGMPSVVYGFWGLTVLVPALAETFGQGTNWLAASLVLALMVLPTIVLLSTALLAEAKERYGRGAAALGLSSATQVWKVAVPAVRCGLAASTVIALSRALGETMAVMMVAGNVPQFDMNPLAPVRTLTANIALEMAYALGRHRAALFASGLVLLAGAALLALLHNGIMYGRESR